MICIKICTTWNVISLVFLLFFSFTIFICFKMNPILLCFLFSLKFPFLSFLFFCQQVSFLVYVIWFIGQVFILTTFNTCCLFVVKQIVPCMTACLKSFFINCICSCRILVNMIGIGWGIWILLNMRFGKGLAWLVNILVKLEKLSTRLQICYRSQLTFYLISHCLYSILLLYHWLD